MTKHTNLFLSFFIILIVSVESYNSYVLGNQVVVPNEDQYYSSKTKPRRRELMMGVLGGALWVEGHHELRRRPHEDDERCDTKPCDPTLDHCKNIPCGDCFLNSNLGTFTCTNLPEPSENCEEEICPGETDKECHAVGCAFGCDVVSFHCRTTLPLPEPEPKEEEETISDSETLIGNGEPVQTVDSEIDTDTTIESDVTTHSETDTDATIESDVTTHSETDTDATLVEIDHSSYYDYTTSGSDADGEDNEQTETETDDNTDKSSSFESDEAVYHGSESDTDVDTSSSFESNVAVYHGSETDTDVDTSSFGSDVANYGSDEAREYHF